MFNPEAVDRLLEERRRAGHPDHFRERAAVEIAAVLRRNER